MAKFRIRDFHYLHDPIPEFNLRRPFETSSINGLTQRVEGVD